MGKKQIVKLDDIVEIDWEDAFWDADPTTEKMWGTECIQTTYGKVCRITDSLVSVAHEIEQGRVYRGVTHIPKSYIKKVIIYGHANS